ncbi:glycine C-acetyltransferase [Candidatus Bathyarchaeota archaeon]|nr:glycine C-acetyltransferase [Candidatus Bathyarchaeota archaeon]MBS7628429.1 glycine C-acetyltransferase [Candidatus Bathyarchaeota archaeon]
MPNIKFTKFIEGKVSELKQAGVFPHIRVLSGPNSTKATLDGKEVLILCANNYLGLANHPEMIQAAKDAVDKYGAGMGTGRMIMTYDIQNKLEDKLAAFKSSQASLCFATGYIANLGGIWPLMEEGDTIISEELNHASIIDGCRMCRGVNRYVYKHLDMKDLENILKTTVDERSKGKTMIISDAVFSMDGDICKLPEMIELAEKYDAFIFLDEAHASGVLGKTGKGTVEHFNAYGKVEVQMGTLSKAIATVGGYIAGSENLIYYLRRASRPFVFSTGYLDPAVCGATMKALEIIEREPERVQRLWDNTRYFKKELNSLGFDTGVSETPITPVIVGEAENAQRLSRYLYEEEGIYVQAFSYPVVPKGKARVRTIVNAHHTKEQLDYALGAFERAGRKLGII